MPFSTCHKYFLSTRSDTFGFLREDEILKKSGVDALWNGDLFYISTFSGRRRTVRDPKGNEADNVIIPACSDSKEIGAALRLAFSRCS